MSISEFKMDDGWRPFHPNPSMPQFVVPDGAVDAHCHVFGPGNRFPYARTRKYTPCDAPKEELRKLRSHLGFDRNVIVQASCHGTDNRALIDSLETSNGLERGVAVVSRDIADAELQVMHKAGVRAVRFNFVRRLVDVVPKDALTQIAERIKSLGWHIVVYFEPQDLPGLYDFFTAMPTTVVVDHMGRPDVSKDPEEDEFDLFLKLLRDNENFWSKVSCPDRLSAIGPPNYEDVVPFAKRVIETIPDRVIWGTDWPHPNLKSHMPDDGKLVDFIPRIAVTEELQRKLLVDNPMRLYWPEQGGEL